MYLASVALAPFWEKIAPERMLNRLEAYNFRPGSTLEERIVPPPGLLLDYYRVLDEAPEYQSYSPSVADKKLLLEYLDLMPRIYADTFKERCAGIYFIDGLKGNGATNWFTDSEGNMYFAIVLNPDSLSADLSATLTAREATCFMPQKGVSIRVDAGTKYKGLLYALIHEGTHGLDYVKGISPVPDDAMPEALRVRPGFTAEYFRACWQDFRRPMAKYDYPRRADITFYGFGSGPRIPVAEAPKLYTALSGGPFVSLYGSMSWIEDMAELATFQLLTRKLGQPYRITVTGLGAPLTLEPMKGATQIMRAGLLMQELDPAGRHINPARTVPGLEGADAKGAEAEALLNEAQRLLDKGGKNGSSRGPAIPR
ncbi:MAG: hypothetical protein AB7V08_13350 [Elusimicrobiales bacterium]